ncbi:MAG: hypothetical protein JRJ85_09930 [Deltaproteobacteria bacterium]|nr:hypothetical protein [Deltaproteobacteria bacterium]
MNESKYYIYHVLGWPSETTAAMTRRLFGGILERFQGIKIIPHHCGTMVPFFDQRIEGAYSASVTIHSKQRAERSIRCRSPVRKKNDL